MANLLVEPTPLTSGSDVPALAADDFAAVFKSRERAKSEHFSLHWRPSPVPVSRFGMVVAKRLTRTAIRRNLIKRQARALFALAAGTAATTPPLRDVVLRLTRNPNALARAAQYAELRGLFAALDAPRGGPR
ncbi:MAG: ribonuclease p protein component [Betaproteobacteria bacterium]|nr:ribonuclease p protein component [Betaproteobacteria bacterium]